MKGALTTFKKYLCSPSRRKTLPTILGNIDVTTNGSVSFSEATSASAATFSAVTADASVSFSETTSSTAQKVVHQQKQNEQLLWRLKALKEIIVTRDATVCIIIVKFNAVASEASAAAPGWLYQRACCSHAYKYAHVSSLLLSFFFFFHYYYHCCNLSIRSQFQPHNKSQCLCQANTNSGFSNFIFLTRSLNFYAASQILSKAQTRCHSSTATRTVRCCGACTVRGRVV